MKLTQILFIFLLSALSSLAAFSQSKIAVTIAVDGDKEAVQVLKFYSTIPIPPEEFARLELIPIADLPLTIKPTFPNVPIEQLLVNGKPRKPLYGSYSVGNLANGDLITVKVGQAAASEVYSVVLHCRPEAVAVYHGNSFQEYTLTPGAETQELQVPHDDPMLRIEPRRGYRISGIETGEGTLLSSPFEVKQDMMVVVNSEEYPRNRQAIVYLQPTLWNSQQITLAPYDPGATSTLKIEGGYSTLYYNSLDFPARLQFASSTGSTQVYFNGEQVFETTPEIYFPNMMPDVAVIKIFAGEPREHEVTIDCEEGVKYRCVVDRVKHIQKRYRCIGPTEMVLTGLYGPIDVRADGEIILADDNGEHHLTITRDTHLRILAEQGALPELQTDDAASLYDLLGRRVLTPTRGLYLRNGRIVRNL